MARETCGGRSGGVSQEEAAWNQRLIREMAAKGSSAVKLVGRN